MKQENMKDDNIKEQVMMLFDRGWKMCWCVGEDEAFQTRAYETIRHFDIELQALAILQNYPLHVHQKKASAASIGTKSGS